MKKKKTHKAHTETSNNEREWRFSVKCEGKKIFIEENKKKVYTKMNEEKNAFTGKIVNAMHDRRTIINIISRRKTQIMRFLTQIRSFFYEPN